jgi:hypothetical protein
MDDTAKIIAEYLDCASEFERLASATSEPALHPQPYAGAVDHNSSSARGLAEESNTPTGPTAVPTSLQSLIVVRPSPAASGI